MCFAIQPICWSLLTVNVRILLCLAIAVLLPIASGCKKDQENAQGRASNQSDTQNVDEEDDNDDDRKVSFNCSMAELSNRIQPQSLRSENYVREIQLGQMTSVISQITELIHSSTGYESISFDHYDTLNDWVASLPVNSIKLWPDDWETNLTGAGYIVRIRIRQQFELNDPEANSAVMSTTMESILSRFHEADIYPESTDGLIDAVFSHATVTARVIGNSEEHYLVEAICFFPPPMVVEDDDSDTIDENNRR